MFLIVIADNYSGQAIDTCRGKEVFANRTLIIVGAGASNECNLPISHDLTTQIARLLDIQFGTYDLKSGDARICDALRMHVHNQRSRDTDLRGDIGLYFGRLCAHPGCHAAGTLH